MPPTERRIEFTPSQKQWEALQLLGDKTTTELGYGGGAFGGKSYLGCFWLTQMWMAYPDTGWLLGRKDLINLKRTTLLTLFKLWKELGVIAGEYNYNQQNNVITHANGSQIFLFDLAYQPSDPLYTRLGGLELTGGFVDESNEVEQSAIIIILTRIGRRNNQTYGIHPKLLECFNPDKGHVYQRYYKPWREKVLPTHRAFVQALPTDNPHVTEDYLNQLRNSDRITKERLLLGNFEYDDDPGTLVPYDAIIDLFTNSVVGGEKYITVDVARFGQDRTVIGVWEGYKLYKIEVLRGQALDSTANRIATLARDERIPYSHIAIDETGVGAGVVDMLRGTKGFVANATPLLNKKGVRENYQNLKTQCTYLMAQHMSSHEVSIRIDGPNGEDLLPPKTKQEIIEEIEQWRAIDIDKDGKIKLRPKEEVIEIIGRSPDLGDMISMRALFEYESTGASETSQHNPHLRAPGRSNVSVVKGNSLQTRNSPPHIYGRRPPGGTMRP